MSAEERLLSGERVVTTTCSYDCGARCVLHVRVSDGAVTGISTDPGAGQGLTACARGLRQADVAGAPDRLRSPLRRVGTRGEGRFEEIGWDEALDAVASELKRVRDRWGPEAVYLAESYGSFGSLHGTSTTARRFFSLLGGCTTRWGNMSLEGAIYASRMTFGAAATGATRDNFLHSKLLVLWGWNPSVTRFGPDTVDSLRAAKKKGIPIVVVDPRRSPTVEEFADQWIALRPGTDTALLLALAHVLITEGLCDLAFVERYTHGFEAFCDHVRGAGDGTPKTPVWAEGITGVPAAVTVELARSFAAARPAALCTGWAPGRSAFGEQFHRAAQVLSAITGNIGVTGGFVGGGTGILPLGSLGASFPVPKAPGPLLHGSEVYDALLQGKAGGFPSDLKLVYVVGSNFLNQFLNVNKGVRALQQPECIVAHELFLTPTARFADYVLPVTHFLEREDVGVPWAGGAFRIHMAKAVEPLEGTRSDLTIFAQLAERLGVGGYNDKPDEQWLQEFVAATPGMPAWESFRVDGVQRLSLPEPFVPFRDQIENPEKFPFRTPSGKIELYSQKMAELNDPLLPPLPTYLPAWEGHSDEGAAGYPLQLVTPHSKARAGSQFYTIPSLKKLASDALWLSPRDAAARGVADGDTVRVSSPRGELVVAARVADGILDGTVSLDAGAWYTPGPGGVDRGGCVNVLTADRKSPGGAFTGSTCRVEVERAG